MPDGSHIDDIELIAFNDREVPAERTNDIERHVESCDLCRERLAGIRRSFGVYEQFHEQVLRPSLADAAYPQLRLTRNTRPVRPVLIWASAFAACLVLAALVLHRDSQSNQVVNLLAQAEAAPPQGHHRIRVTSGASSWLRPASLRSRSNQNGLQEVETLFKRDHVLSLHGADGGQQIFRVQTETRDSSLQSASLTLRAEDLAAVGGAFTFERDRTVQLTDAGEIVERPQPDSKPEVHSAAPPEGSVSPADELRVLAALDEIGADVDDPVSVARDNTQQRVVVTGIGIRPSRQNEIRKTLLAIPRTVVRFLSHVRANQNSASRNLLPYAADANPQVRRWLEDRTGGPQQLERSGTEGSDASAALLARAHALLVLAGKFPPDVEASLGHADRETLLALRHRHAAAIEQRALELKRILRPLTEARQGEATHGANSTSWQSGAETLYEDARALDDVVGRLLGARYSQEQSEGVLARLPHEIEDVEALARGQTAGP